MIEKPIYIITGGPGFGKTCLIEELRQLGYLCCGEFARDLILSQQESGGNILPWKNPGIFQQEILKKRMAFFGSVPEGIVAFADRGIPDQLAFAKHRGFGNSEILKIGALEYRYATQVFVTPPWPEIYVNDPTRTEPFEEALLIHDQVVETYISLNYQIIELPLLPLSQRVKYLLNILLNLETNGN